jgi:hypothetical protein
LRRHVGDEPDPRPIKLLDGLEASQVTLYLEGISIGILSEWHRNEDGGQSNLTSLKGLSIAIRSPEAPVGLNFKLNDNKLSTPDKYNVYALRFERMIAVHAQFISRHFLNRDEGTMRMAASTLGNAIRHIRQLVLEIDDAENFYWFSDLVGESLLQNSKSRNQQDLDHNVHAITSTLRLSSYYTYIEDILEALLGFSLHQLQLRHGKKPMSFEWILGVSNGTDAAKTMQEKYRPWIGNTWLVTRRVDERPLTNGGDIFDDNPETGREILGIGNSILCRSRWVFLI